MVQGLPVNLIVSGSFVLSSVLAGIAGSWWHRSAAPWIRPSVLNWCSRVLSLPYWAVTVLVLPGLAALLGIFMWWRRR